MGCPLNVVVLIVMFSNAVTLLSGASVGGWQPAADRAAFHIAHMSDEQ